MQLHGHRLTCRLTAAAAAWPADLTFVDDVCGGGWRVGASAVDCGGGRKRRAFGCTGGSGSGGRAGRRRRRQRDQRTWLRGWRAVLGLRALL